MELVVTLVLLHLLRYISCSLRLTYARPDRLTQLLGSTSGLNLGLSSVDGGLEHGDNALRVRRAEDGGTSDDDVAPCVGCKDTSRRERSTEFHGPA